MFAFLPLARRAASLIRSAVMLVVHVRMAGERERSYYFERSEISIGRVDGQDIELRADDVSRRHARVSWRGDRVRITDNSSTNGTYVNSRRIQGAVEAASSELSVEICGFRLTFEITEGRTKKPGVPTLPSVSPSPSEITGPTPKGPGSLSASSSPTRPSLRKLLDSVLPSDEDIDVFSLDYFHGTYSKFTAGMTRLAKQNLLLQLPCSEVLSALRRYSKEKVNRYLHILEYESASSP